MYRQQTTMNTSPIIDVIVVITFYLNIIGFYNRRVSNGQKVRRFRHAIICKSVAKFSFNYSHLNNSRRDESLSCYLMIENHAIEKNHAIRKKKHAIRWKKSIKKYLPT